MSLSHLPKIVTNGLVLCLDASDIKSYPKSGTTWFDRSGNGNNGTLVNGVGYSSGNGGVLAFDGVDDYVEIIIWHNHGSNRDTYSGSGDDTVWFGAVRVSQNDLCGW